MNAISKVITKTSKPIVFEAGALARAADGSCRATLGNSSVLISAVSRQKEEIASGGFLPLTVDYKEEAAAAGRIPTTHLRRDLGTTEKEILTGRMIDRSLRNSFPKYFYDDTQVVCHLLATDGNNNPDVLAINGASATLAISDIPWNGPIGAVRVGLVDNTPIIFPTRKDLFKSRADLVLAANNQGNLVMIDASFKEPIPLTELFKLINKGIKECKLITDSISLLQSKIGKPKRLFNSSHAPSPELTQAMRDLGRDKIWQIFIDYTHTKASRSLAVDEVKLDVFKELKDKYSKLSLDLAFVDLIKRTYVDILTDVKKRCDGRKFDQLRPIDCQVNLHEPLHGSAIFQRGQTQVFTSCTFDSPDAAFPSDYITLLTSGVKDKNFMLHYEFPKFATSEIGKAGGFPDRREIGHGALAEKALRPGIPEDSEFTIRLKCKVLESNGSSSMASVCAGSMALLDAGVKLKEHLAGVAFGLFMDPQKNEPIILTDILGLEDFFGEMDFKIAGSVDNITAIQLDTKLPEGITSSIVNRTIDKSRKPRAKIIENMRKVIDGPRDSKKDSHPVTKTIHVPAHKRNKFIGFEGHNLKRLLRQCGVKISEFTPEDTSSCNLREPPNFMVFAPNKDAMQEADETIDKLLRKEDKEPNLEFGGIYIATIVDIRDNGVMVTFYPKMKPALIPLKELDMKAVQRIEALNLEIGQQVQVKYFGNDPVSGSMRISRRAIQISATPRSHDLSAQEY